MKILLCAAIDVALPGGLETHVRELALALAARGHDVAVNARASMPVPFPLVVAPAFDAWDVVHHHAGPWPAALARHPATLRTLHFCVAAKMDVYVRLGRLRTLANLANWRAVLDERAVARGQSPVIAVAERVRRDFARFHGLDPGRVTVISNGVPPPRASEGRAALRQRHGLGEQTRVLLTIGRPDFVKGHDLLERAWQRSGAAARGAVWVNVGGRAAARAPGHLVTGPVSHEEATAWITAADLGALPSYYEGCSVALLEMLDAGLYTLAHDVGNAAEVVRERENGEVLARDERVWSARLEQLLAAPPPRSSGLPAAFRWPAVAERTESVYRTVLARG